MKTGRIFKLITAAGLALGLLLTPLTDIPVLRDFGITASAASVGSGLSWTLAGGTLTVSGNGAMTHFSSASDQPWASNRTQITKVVIESGVTVIGKNSFINCSELKSVIIKCNSAWIGEDAFRYSDKLTEVTITNPNGLRYPNDKANAISSGAFKSSDDTKAPALTVYCCGTEDDWNTLKSKTGGTNDRFKNATVKYVREITLNANNGSGATDTRYLEYNKEVTLPDCPFTAAANKHFKCWAKDAAGTNQYGSTASFTAATTLYAIWEDDEYTISFNANGGTGAPANQKTKSKKLESLPDSAVSKTGYTLGGWYTAASGGDKVTTSTVFSSTSGKTLYAHWKANTYTVAYNGNGSTGGSTSSSSHTYDSAKNLTSNGFERKYTVSYDAKGGSACSDSTAAYGFSKWNTAANGSGTSYNNSASVSNLTTTANGTVTLYAQWTSASVTLPSPTRTGYSFGGWYSGSTLIGAGGASYTPTANITLTAKWNANTYTVTYNENYGSNSTSTKTVTYDSNYILQAAPARTGYTFGGWFTEKTGGTQITDSTKVQITSAQTLYAHWSANSYTVRYNGNGSTSGSTGSSTHTYDTPQDLNANGFVKEYTVSYNANDGTACADSKATYTFNGWNTAAGGSGTSYGSSASVNNLTAVSGGTVDLYAQWTDSVSVTLNSTSREGYTFDGWYEDSGLTGTSYPAGALYTPAADITLYAKWNANTYTVTYDYNDGVTPPLVYDETYDGTYINLPAPTMTGYTFAGWWTDKTDGTQILDTSKVKIADNHTLYARWTINSYAVTFVPNGGSAVAAQNIDYRSKAAVPETPAKTGYTFIEWCSDEALNTHYDFSTEVTGAITLYAKWEANTYTVKYDGNGSTGGGTADSTHTYDDSSGTLTPNGFERIYTVTYEANGGTGCDAQTAEYTFKYWTATTEDTGTSYNNGASVLNLTPSGTAALFAQWESHSVTLPATEKTGHTFIGWYEDPGFSGDKCPATYTPTQNITLYAGWDANPYTVTLHTNYGEISSGSEVTGYTYGVGAALPTDTEITRTGYTFGGWFESEDCTGTPVEAITETDLGDKTFYALWTANTYTVRYNGSGNTGGGTADSTHTYNTSSDLTPNGFERIYTVTYEANGGSAPASDAAVYTFTGWTDGTNTYIDGTSVLNLTDIPNGTVDLYAEWDSNSVTLPMPARDGYIFDGWYIEPEFTGAQRSAGDSYTPAADITFYAKWLCIHVYGEEASPAPENLKTPATCETKAVYYQVCAQCGDVHTTDTYEYGEPLGHAYGGEPVWNWNTADYSSATATFTCANDGSHKDTVSADITSEPVTVTCTEEGDMKYTAAVIYNGITCTNDKTVGVDAMGHSFPADYTTDRYPTCTSEGEESIHCTVCGVIYAGTERPIAMLLHTPDEAVTENPIEVTCTTDGSYDDVIYCALCHTELSRENMTVEAAGHTPGEWIAVTPPTFTEDGEKLQKCTVCGEELDRKPIEKLGTPAPETDPTNGSVSEDLDNNTGTKVNTSRPDELIEKCLDSDDITDIANGHDIEIVLEVTDISSAVPSDDKAEAETVLANREEIAMYVDFSLFKITDGTEKTQLHNSNAPIVITVKVPDSIYREGWKYAIIRVHDGEAEKLACDYNAETHELTFYTDKFSTYALSYTKISTGDDPDSTGGNPDSTGGMGGTGGTGGNLGGYTPVIPVTLPNNPDDDTAAANADDTPIVEDVASGAGITANEFIIIIERAIPYFSILIIITISGIAVMEIRKRIRRKK